MLKAEEANGDVDERYYETTTMLRKCMDVHVEYYESILRADTSSQSAQPPAEEGASKNQVVVQEKEDSMA
ncbi:hypothetical protein GUJ93_ZPchr0006g44852 [Zizania palustris]|uniref:GCK domain-containing protein n=1 Tax=Zizania palustris TaxID=103762 RepID=A0A8J5VGR5_ZIZPA|nr:hypothetical protein GUJ93_ZPchr0006g44852 [Zizania palustris]